jgi:hypothetical protein
MDMRRFARRIEIGRRLPSPNPPRDEFAFDSARDIDAGSEGVEDIEDETTEQGEDSPFKREDRKYRLKTTCSKHEIAFKFSGICGEIAKSHHKKSVDMEHCCHDVTQAQQCSIV